MTDRSDGVRLEAVRENASADAAPELFAPVDAPHPADCASEER